MLMTSRNKFDMCMFLIIFTIGKFVSCNVRLTDNIDLCQDLASSGSGDDVLYILDFIIENIRYVLEMLKKILNTLDETIHDSG